MNILFHTIAIEPARWTPLKVARPLAETIPIIEQAGFYPLEIFEPHLALAENEEQIRGKLLAHHLNPVVLSSYMDLAPAVSDDGFRDDLRSLAWRMRFYGFRKVRLFPGRGVSPTDKAATEIVAARVRAVAEELPLADVLLETHDGSIADDPVAVCELVAKIDRGNVGLLWQPTIFEREAALKQFQIQKDLIRHFHLQNRDESKKFTLLRSGVIPWKDILTEVDFDIDASIEFVPKGLLPVEHFNLTAAVQEAIEEFDYIVQLQG